MFKPKIRQLLYVASITAALAAVIYWDITVQLHLTEGVRQSVIERAGQR